MSKSSKIRWRDRDTQQLARKVKNFNAKLTRLTKSNPALAEILPERVSAKALKHDITNRQEYNRVIKALSAFTEKGAEQVVTGKQGVTTTKWQLQQVKKAVAIENRRRKKEAERLSAAPVMIGGKLYTNVRRMAGAQAMQPLQIRLDTRTQASWDNFVRYMESQMLGGGQADEQRYLQACLACWRGMCSAAQVSLLKDTMERIGVGKCLKAYYNGMDELRPEYIYDAVYTQQIPVSAAVQNIVNSMHRIAGYPELHENRLKGHYNRGVKTAPRNKYKFGESEED